MPWVRLFGYGSVMKKLTPRQLKLLDDHAKWYNENKEKPHKHEDLKEGLFILSSAIFFLAVFGLLGYYSGIKH